MPSISILGHEWHSLSCKRMICRELESEESSESEVARLVVTNYGHVEWACLSTLRNAKSFVSKVKSELSRPPHVLKVVKAEITLVSRQAAKAKLIENPTIKVWQLKDFIRNEYLATLPHLQHEAFPESFWGRVARNVRTEFLKENENAHQGDAMDVDSAGENDEMKEEVVFFEQEVQPDVLQDVDPNHLLLAPDHELKESDGHPNDERDREECFERCHQCTGVMGSILWKHQCSRTKCKKEGHAFCMVPDPEHPELRMYCREHWELLHGHAPSSETDTFGAERIQVLRILRFLDLGKSRHFFCDKSNPSKSWAKWDDEVTVEEQKAVNGSEAMLSNSFQNYAIREIDSKMVRLTSAGGEVRSVKVRRFTMAGCLAPFIVVDQFLLPVTQHLLTLIGMDWYLHGSERQTTYPKGVQFTKNQRIKCATHKAYKTGVSAPLEDSDLPFEELFPREDQQQAVRAVCMDLYDVATAVGLRNIEWLRHPNLPQMAPIMLTLYRGHGLKAHVDERFQGPVFVVTIMIRKSQLKSKNPNGARMSRRKKICFGMFGEFEINADASLENEERQMYFFYGYLTDWGVHGVPKMKGWTSIVLIVREPRQELIDRFMRPC